METKKMKLLVDVTVIIEIDENHIDDNNEILKAIRLGNITEVIAPYRLEDERYDNDNIGEELSWCLQAPMASSAESLIGCGGVE